MKELLLKNCLIFSPTNGGMIKKEILIVSGKIKEISDKVYYKSDSLVTVDVKENHVFPGFIDCHTHIGIIEEAVGKIGIDNNEISDPITPHLRGIDGINPFDIAFKDALRSGVTSVMSGPGSNNPVGGLSAAIKTSGSIIDNMIIKSPVGLKIALGENPLSTYGINKKCPVTRMGTAGLIRELFMRAQDYMELKEKGEVQERDIKLEAVIPVLKGKIPIRAHAHRADDIITAVRIAQEFGINKLTIEHGTEAHLVKDYLKEKNIPVAFGPVLTPRIKMELKNRNYNSVLELVEHGVTVALVTDHPYNPIDQLRTVAALSIAQGLAPREALRAITTSPAEIMGCQDTIGKLEVGYDADIAIFNGNPFDINSKVLMTIINGQVVYKSQNN